MFGVLRDYVKAFDHDDEYTCYLKSWTALERLNDTITNDVIIKRCSIIFNNKDTREFEKQILIGLKEYRNEIVHEGPGNLRPFPLCYQIQRYLKYLILLYHLPLAGKVNSIKYINDLLDKRNLNNRELEIEMDVLNRAIMINRKVL